MSMKGVDGAGGQSKNSSRLIGRDARRKLKTHGDTAKSTRKQIVDKGGRRGKSTLRGTTGGERADRLQHLRDTGLECSSGGRRARGVGDDATIFTSKDHLGTRLESPSRVVRGDDGRGAALN